MVLLSLPRSRFVKLPAGHGNTLCNGTHFEMLFVSDTNLALDSKFHRLMSSMHRYLFNSEAFVTDATIGFYLTRVKGVSAPNAGTTNPTSLHLLIYNYRSGIRSLCHGSFCSDY